MAVTNPFRYRATEQQRQLSTFHRTFGVEMLEVLPSADLAWDRLVVLRSAPGAGKTSILRLLSAESLSQLVRAPGQDDVIRGLRVGLKQMGAMGEAKLQILGVMVSVNKDYKSVIDLGPKGSGQSKVFRKLLDARLITRAIESILAANGLRYSDAASIRFVPREGQVGDVARFALAQVADGLEESEVGQGVMGDILLRAARSRERQVIELLDSLVPVDWNAEVGHSRLYSLALFSSVDIEVQGVLQPYRPVFLFDDVHDLAPDQRDVLYDELLDRTLDVGRWIAERQEAVPDEELLTGRIDGRDLVLVQLEAELIAGAKGGQSHRLQRILGSIANARATTGLNAIEVDATFTTLLQGADSIGDERKQSALEHARDRVLRLVAEHSQYSEWSRSAEQRSDRTDAYEAAIHWRELEILIERDMGRSQPALFDMIVETEKASQMASSGTRGAARLFLASELKLPYYYGAEMLADLSSRNIEQYLGVAGDLFDQVVSAVTARKRNGSPFLTAEDQDQRIRRSSRQLWEAIPRRVAYGPDVLALLHTIADHSRYETYRATAPYPPGATGTAIDFWERRDLFARQVDSRGSRYVRLQRALSSAVANNLLEMSSEPNRTKGQQLAVLYLNRLLLPHFDLPLQRGGFREQSISKLARRLDIAVKADASQAVPNPQTHLRDLEGWPK